MKDLFTLKNALIAIVILYIINYWKKKSSATPTKTVQTGNTPIATIPEETKPDLSGAVIPEVTTTNEVAQITIGDVKNTVVEAPAVQLDYSAPLSPIGIINEQVPYIV